MLKVGDRSPLNTTVLDSAGRAVALKGLLGKRVLVYFYPKDGTTGCTKEACNIRDWRDEIQKRGVKIVGVSKDSPTSHQKFVKKYKLNFTLWSDPEHKLMDAFGVWQKKKFMGREYMGTVRSSFAVDSAGKVIHVWEKVTPDNHGEEIFNFFKGLKT